MVVASSTWPLVSQECLTDGRPRIDRRWQYIAYFCTNCILYVLAIYTVRLAMFGRKQAKQQQSAPRPESVIPEGCQGVTSAETHIVTCGEYWKERHDPYLTNTTIKFACPGLLDDVVTIHQARTEWSNRTYESVKFGKTPFTEEDYATVKRRAMQEAGVHIVAKCATCPLGLLGRQRQEAEIRTATRDELELRLRIAEAETRALELQRELSHEATAAPILPPETEPSDPAL